MADPAVDPPLFLTGDLDPESHISPLDSAFFSDDLLIGDGASGDVGNGDVSAFEGLDFDFYFDDLCLPSSGGLDGADPAPLQNPYPQSGSSPNHAHFGPTLDQMHSVFKSTYPELRDLSGADELPVDRSWEGSGVLSSSSPEMESQQISEYLNMPSPESNGSNRDSAENCGGDAPKVSNCISTESGDFDSNVSEYSNNCATRSVSSSPDLSKCLIRTGVLDEKIKIEEPVTKNGSTSFLKRKKEVDESMDKDDNVESRTNKYMKSNCSGDNNISSSNINNVESMEEEEKRKARLVRNRESAQLSRQRKKHYVEELEDKVRNMHSTIQDLNAKISFFMAENVTLRQQMSGGAGAAVPPSPIAPTPPGMYTHPAMMYPWMPCPPPYMVKPQGSQVPLVPIPRLKTQKSTQSKAMKKGGRKKDEGPKTKKVAGVSFLGLLFFMMLFGGLVPIVNVRYGGVKEAFIGRQIYNIGAGFIQKHHGRVLMVNGTKYDEMKDDSFRDSNGKNSSGNEVFRSGNVSEPLAASLYVPRNDKLVKIDGNLIIHSVLATEKAMVVAQDLAPAIPVSGDKDSVKSTTTDGKLQQWFREGLAGPMLSAGLCTEVFQFDISAPGAIIPATTTRNISEEQNQTSSHPKSGRNRRILHPIPLPKPSLNMSRDQTSSEEHKNTSSMVVSVLFDPREAGDGDVDGVMGAKSLSRIFVVVLIDSVKYVTYSCMLPFTGSVPHLVTA